MRIASEKDLVDIFAIYNSTISKRLSTADTFEVSVESKLEWFRQHDPKKRPLYVYEDNGKIVAWVSFQSFYGRPAYENTAEISIYITPESRGKGLGKTLLKESLELTKQFNIKTLVGFIFSHNIPSIKLFKSFGFEEWGMLPNVAEMDGRCPFTGLK